MGDSAPTVAALLVLGYVLGSCPWGYWLVRLFKREDVRSVGSGNIGASNVWRVYGTSLGVPVVALDVLKGFVPTLLAVILVSHVTAIAVGAAAMLGHWRPLFLRFEKGGKIVATGGGAFFALAPLAALAAVPVWAALFLLFGYASIASLAAAACLPLAAWLFAYPRSVVAFAVATAAGVTFLHRANLGRLLHGTENRSRIAALSRLRPLKE